MCTKAHRQPGRQHRGNPCRHHQERGIEATVRAGLYYGLFEELNKPYLRPAARPRKAKLRKALIELGVKGRFKTQAAGAGIEKPR